MATESSQRSFLSFTNAVSAWENIRTESTSIHQEESRGKSKIMTQLRTQAWLSTLAVGEYTSRAQSNLKKKSFKIIVIGQTVLSGDHDS